MECMKLKYTTKLQSQGGSLATSVPKLIKDSLSLSKGDSLEWEIDLQTQKITVKKLEE